MDFLVQRIVNKMLLFDLVSEHEKEYYNYYIELALEKMIAMSTIFVMAFWMDRIVEMILFIVAFSSIRKYAGGYHCNTFHGCYLLSMCVSFVCISPLFDSRLNLSKMTFIIFTILCTGVILMIGAVNHPDMHWDDMEQRNSKNIAKSIVMLLGGSVISLCYLDIFQDYVIYIAEGIWINALSMLIAKIIRQEVKA